MAGSGAKRLQASNETAAHIEENDRVAQIAEQVNDRRTYRPLYPDEPLLMEVGADRGLLPHYEEDATNDLVLFKPGELNEINRDRGVDYDLSNASSEIMAKARSVPNNTVPENDKPLTLEQFSELEARYPGGFPGGQNIADIINLAPRQRQRFAPNLLEDLTTEQRGHIAQVVLMNYEADKESRSDWEAGYENARKLLAHEEIERKKQGASNPKAPHLQTAAQQFESRISPILISQAGPLVKMYPQGFEPANLEPPQIAPGQQPTPEQQQQMAAAMKASQKTERALRVSKYLSYLLRRKNKHWITDTRKMMMKLAIFGTVFRKVYYSAERGCVMTRIIDAADIIVKNTAASLEDAPRISHRFELEVHEVIAKIRAGIWEDISDTAGLILDETPDAERQELEFIEQHCRFDIDGDGFAEPVIVTIHKGSQQLCRIEKNYDDEDVVHGGMGDEITHIEPRRCFVMYTFLPDASGGLYGIGLGHTMQQIMGSLNTLQKQITDNAILQNSAGGLISRGVKFSRGQNAGGQVQLAMNRWSYVNSSGDEISKGLHPFRINQPSQITFSLLEMLDGQARDLSAVKDPLSASDMSAGMSNAPVGTVHAIIEQNLSVFTGIMSGIYTSMSTEFEELYKVTGRYLNLNDYVRV
ncbi:MAG: hypothetical protein VXX04_07835, partial [Actinomycetota bacterium]|nr:hypothetical protein [Actinomycetota bacterium]MEC7290469.1 hypothetical protein [Pseudomonadota bacterium]